MSSESSAAPANAAEAVTHLEATALTASLTVRDLTASVAWYRDVVGFKVEREVMRDGQRRAAAVSAGSVRLLLNQDDGAKGMDRKKGQGMSFMLQTRQSIDGIARRITEHGGKLDSEPADMPWGARVFRLHDPDGFSFSISTPIG
jgi:uncharacterized glyoxalase superfamily protein PhnB